jgi:hypothetical protein
LQLKEAILSLLNLFEDACIVLRYRQYKNFFLCQ